jgi:anaerobic ribonucleoside-triphosphate reductase activating protein
LQIIVNGNIEPKLVEQLVTEEKESFARQGKQIAKIIITDCGDEIEVRTYEKSPIRRVRRITGYLANTDNWGAAKLAELRDRVMHTNVNAMTGTAPVKTGVTLQVNGLVYESVVDGPGLRDLIFVQGCPHRCPGCHNPGSWDFEGGTVVDIADVVASIPSSPLISGITISGGEPFCQAANLLEVAQYIKDRGLNLWVYTGYTWAELLTHPDPAVNQLLALTDVVVDGRFEQDKADLSLPFRGSANQRLIDVQASLQAGRVILWRCW